MSQTRLIAIVCRISRGVVSDERAFEISLNNGTLHSSVAPAHYFWNDQGKPLAIEEPGDECEITGKIAARLLGKKGNALIVSIPDGSVVTVDEKITSDRPSEIVINVPVRSRS